MAYSLCGKDIPLVRGLYRHSCWILDSQLSPSAILFPKDTHQDKEAGNSAETWPHCPFYKAIWLQGQELRTEDLGRGTWGRGPGAGDLGQGTWAEA